MTIPLLTIEEVVAATAEYFSLPVEAIRSPDHKTWEVTYARHMAQYLSRKLTYKSLRHIAGEFSLSDHTGVLYAVNKISNRLAFDHAKTERDARQIEAIMDEKRKPKKVQS